MRILALEPYYGGSHRAFLDGWIQRSVHDWQLLTLPAHHWKWRMRHAAVTFAQQVDQLVRKQGAAWDLLWCSDMLNLAEFLGLVNSSSARDLPAVAYFHENQLTYPVTREDERDLHFGFTNLTTALAARVAWFNSEFHRQDFLAAAERFVRPIPASGMLQAVADVRDRSQVHPPGIELSRSRAPSPLESPSGDEPLRIVWAARWEHDKDPETFFAALFRLQQDGVPFRLAVVGQSFRSVPPIFEEAHRRLVDQIHCWGYLEDRELYLETLRWADVVVSTARHEFFGLSVLEAITAGAVPLLPDRLSYPELLWRVPTAERDPYFYNGSVEQLVQRLRAWSSPEARGPLRQLSRQAREATVHYGWASASAVLDGALESLL